MAGPSEQGGLLDATSVLDGPGFMASDLAQPVVDFLRTLGRNRTVTLPFGNGKTTRMLGRSAPGAITALMDSQVLTVRDQQGSQVGAAWLRTLRSTGQAIYSGWYKP